MHTATVQPAAVPPIQDAALRYRLYTVAHLPFDALPEYPAGPAKVTVTEWGVSYGTLCAALSSASVVAEHDGMATLNVHHGHFEDGHYVAEKHELDGTKHATIRDAERAAYGAGLTAFMVFERDAAKWGLPVGE